jgi:uncharacterized protein (TIGR03382 family)
MILAVTALLLATLSPAAAYADWLYDFTWHAEHEAWTLGAGPAPRRRSWQDHGRGRLRLVPDATGAPAVYEVILDGRPLGRIALGADPAFHPRCERSPGYCGGSVRTAGRPERPATLRLSLVDSSSPHCVVDCRTTVFEGRGRLRASEPAAGYLAALVLGALALGRRRR